MSEGSENRDGKSAGGNATRQTNQRIGGRNRRTTLRVRAHTRTTLRTIRAQLLDSRRSLETSREAVGTVSGTVESRVSPGCGATRGRDGLAHGWRPWLQPVLRQQRGELVFIPNDEKQQSPAGSAGSGTLAGSPGRGTRDTIRFRVKFNIATRTSYAR